MLYFTCWTSLHVDYDVIKMLQFLNETLSGSVLHFKSKLDEKK